MKRRLGFLLGSLIILTSAACGGEAKAHVAVQSFEFRPPEISVEAGTEVSWVNEDRILHTVTSGIAGEQGVPGVSGDVEASPDGRFDLDLDGRGSSAAFTFEQPGMYPYFCSFHSGMSGVVQVG